MSGQAESDVEGRGDEERGGVAGLSAFRDRPSRSGPPVLPPGWRPNGDDRRGPTVHQAELTVVPFKQPPLAPAGGRVATPATSRPVVTETQVVSGAPARAEIKVVRGVRPWSVWKLTLAFALCLVAVGAISAALVWAMASNLGVLDNAEGFVKDMGFDDFTFHGETMFRSVVIGGLILAVAASIMAFLLAVMFNLLSDLTGGIETELAPGRPRRARRRRRRRKGEPVVDLTDGPEELAAKPEPDGVQLALDDLLAE